MSDHIAQNENQNNLQREAQEDSTHGGSLRAIIEDITPGSISLSDCGPSGGGVDGIAVRGTTKPLHLGVSLRRFAYVTASFPLCTLSACFLYSVAFSYSIVNTTICKVFNVLPSLSAVTGVYPQCQLWRMAVALYFGPQIFLASMLPSYYKGKQLEDAGGLTRWAYSKVIMLSAVSHILECLCLIGVAFISSKESFRMHVLLFCSFATFYIAHLISTCWIVTRFRPATSEQDTSRRYKLRLAMASGVCALIMTVFFYLHRTRCVVMAFSVFALAEYVFGLSNILFHLTIIYDLPEVQIDIAFGGLRSLSTVSSAVSTTSSQTITLLNSGRDSAASASLDTKDTLSKHIQGTADIIAQYPSIPAELSGEIEDQQSTEQASHRRRFSTSSTGDISVTDVEQKNREQGSIVDTCSLAEERKGNESLKHEHSSDSKKKNQ